MHEIIVIYLISRAEEFNNALNLFSLYNFMYVINNLKHARLSNTAYNGQVRKLSSCLRLKPHKGICLRIISLTIIYNFIATRRLSYYWITLFVKLVFN